MAIDMQLRHFEMIAKTIREDLNRDIRHEVAEAFAASLAKTNDRFDVDRFIAAASGRID